MSFDIQYERENKHKKENEKEIIRTILKFFSLFLLIMGFFIILFNSNFYLAIGVILIVMGNNVAVTRMFQKW